MSEIPDDLRKYIADAIMDAIKDGPVVVTQEKFMEALLMMWVRGVADGRRGVRFP